MVESRFDQCDNPRDYLPVDISSVETGDNERIDGIHVVEIAKDPAEKPPGHPGASTMIRSPDSAHREVSIIVVRWSWGIL